MVSTRVVVVVLAAFVQAAYSAYVCQCDGASSGNAPAGYEYGCCPGDVVEEKIVINKPATETYTYQEPYYTKKCYQRSAGVDKQVVPKVVVSQPSCETQETTVRVPTTETELNEQALCRKTCTTSEYTIQIPIVETTCTSQPLCKKDIRSQDNILTTVAKKVSCAKQTCTNNEITEKPLYETVCQNYQGSVNKVGTKTVIKPEIIKKCVQLPPYRCLKPISSSSSSDASAAAAAAAAAYSSDVVFTSSSDASAAAAAAAGSAYSSDVVFSSSSDVDAAAAAAAAAGSYYTSAPAAGSYYTSAPAASSYYSAPATSSYYTSAPVYQPASYSPAPTSCSCTCA